jgi:hypothetical protein
MARVGCEAADGEADWAHVAPMAAIVDVNTNGALERERAPKVPAEIIACDDG